MTNSTVGAFSSSKGVVIREVEEKQTPAMKPKELQIQTTGALTNSGKIKSVQTDSTSKLEGIPAKMLGAKRGDA